MTYVFSGTLNPTQSVGKSRKKMRSSGQFSLIGFSALNSLQCIDTVGLVTGRAYSL